MDLTGRATAAASPAVHASAAPVVQRLDIEGLRGVAVLAVFAVHSLPQSFRGGFVGVDVFFVISGYLIARLSLAELQRSASFDVPAFYLRRWRRLAPALLLVLACCAVFAITLAYPRDTREIGRHVAGGTAFVSNLLLWREAGYFDAASTRKLLLHLWSLGIEAQFYLLWPLIALALPRLGRHALLVVGIVALLSFLLNVSYVADKPKGTFFLPPTRFWELLLGVLLAMLQDPVHGRRMQHAAARGCQWLGARPSASALSLAGMALLAASAWLVDENSRFPGWWALMPTLGTCLIIAAGPAAWFNRVVLAHPVLGFYGRISYALYLWHWPLLTAPLLLGVVMDLERQVLLLCTAVALAAATQRWVEQPLRGFARSTGWLAGGFAVLAAAGLWLAFTDAALLRYAQPLRAIAAIDLHGDYQPYRIERCFLRSEQRAAAFADECADASPTTRPLMLLWGDSHAAALYPGLRTESTASATPWRMAQFTAAACPPGWTQPLIDSPHCDEISAHVLERIGALQPRRVVLAANWSLGEDPARQPDARAALRATVAALRERGVPDIVLIGAMPKWPMPPPRALIAAWAEAGSLPQRVVLERTAGALALERELAATAAGLGVRFVSAWHGLCDGTGCRIAVPESGGWQAVAFDDSHLTAAGSRWLVRSLAGRLGL